ncbi:hypothetical protein, partial [Nocardia farcinica]|uniref:hypothetical protein n=1 Tax=Nocardia farcinica TaxID=37329 RepID=UPI0034DB1C46
MHGVGSRQETVEQFGVIRFDLALAIVPRGQHYFEPSTAINDGLGENRIRASCDAADADEVVVPG